MSRCSGRGALNTEMLTTQRYMEDMVELIDIDSPLADLLPTVALFVLGVPMLTVLAMTAAAYIGSGTF
ncbi:MAG: hypothetical protein ACI8TX_001236 [Hyphomicrobiaceae bacterium]|jgi:hypothetical protein